MPDLVLGSPGVKCIRSGVAKGPICFLTQSFRSLSSSPVSFSPGLPKTRSGKIMRRILRKIAANEHEQLGDTTTLADPSVVKSLVDNRKNI